MSHNPRNEDTTKLLILTNLNYKVIIFNALKGQFQMKLSNKQYTKNYLCILRLIMQRYSINKSFKKGIIEIIIFELT